MIQDFHFLRPEWFYAVIPALLLYLIMRYREGRGSAWERTIDPALLPFLLDKQSGKPTKNPRFLLLLGWTLGICALAGPVWEQTPQPVHERENALVIVLDLTRSMYATDVKPNRLIRARRKLLDLLDERNEGVTGLIVYAGDAHLVSPLTDDSKTIAELIPSVSPEIMPAQGSQLAPAISLAHNLFTDAGIASGRILIVTDEIRDVAQAQAIARQSRYAFPVSVLAVGTEEGAPILDPKIGYMRDSNGQMVIPKVDFSSLREFANIAGGRFSAMTLVDSDLEFLLAEQPLDEDQAFRETDRDFDIWYEEGPWLLLLLLPIAALGFRRGWLWQISLVCMLPLAPVNQAQASLWDDLWRTGDQQGQELLEANAPDIAAEKFDDPAWAATAQYRAENYEAAANTFAGLPNADSAYNAGNAFAKAGQYEAAIDAYNKAIELDSDHDDAKFNKALVEELLKSKEEQQQQDDGEGDDQQSENQDQNDADGDQAQDSENQQSQDGEQQDADNAEEQNADQQEQAEQQEQEEGEAKDQQYSESDAPPLTDEEQQALQQWLRKVPDDPGGLLRRKFEMQYQERLKRRGVTNQNDDSSNW
jgi:Ca-activated chloride channel family protein